MYLWLIRDGHSYIKDYLPTFNKDFIIKYNGILYHMINCNIKSMFKAMK